MSEPVAKRRHSYLTVSQEFNLQHASRMVEAAFRDIGFGVYQVGSSLRRQDWRDVDLRALLETEAFAAMFGANPARLSFLNVAISEWLSARTGLPIDFQFQAQSDANERFPGEPRNFIAPAIKG